MIFQGESSAASQTLTLPTHTVGDLILMLGRYPNTPPGAPPAAGGTVPTWTILESSGAAFLSLVTAWARATASNHTSGTWTGFGHLACMVLRPDTGKTIAPAGVALAGTASVTTIIRYPALTLTTLSGTSWGVRMGTRVGASADVATAPPGWTNQCRVPTGASCLMSGHTRANLVAHPVQEDVAITGSTGVYRGHTVEITETAPVRMVTIA